MSYSGSNDFIQALEKAGELRRISVFCDPVLEIAEIIDRISKNNGPALLFENTGFAFPLLINALGSEKRMCIALGVENLDIIGKEIEELFKKLSAPKNSVLDKIRMLPELGRIASWMPKVRSGKGECQEVVHMNPDITKLPVMQCWPADGGRFLTLPIIHTIDPENQQRNVGMYRMQIISPTITAMHWHKHKVSAGHFNKYKKLHQKMPVAVALGGDPVYTYAATAPLPPNVDEYLLAGFIRKKKVELVKCITNDMVVPADADFIIEGYVDPDEELILEGPFGDHTGYYSLADYYPKFHITCITHKKNPVYPSTIVGIPPQEDAWIGKATERIFLTPIKMTFLPEVEDMDMPIVGVFHNLVIVKIKKEFAGQAQKVMNAMWGAGQMMFNKILVIVDHDIDIHNYKNVAQVITKNVNPANDLYFSSGPMDVLDHSCSKFAYGGKVCVDATQKYEEEKSDSIEVPLPVSIGKEDILKKYSSVKYINDDLLKTGVSAVCIAIEKTKKGQVIELHQQLMAEQQFASVKFIVYVDHTVQADDIGVVTWNFSNNIDPKRDMIITKHANGTSTCGIDGTRKTKLLDNFDRPWPNVIVMDDDTIHKVDARWKEYGLGEFLRSPSLQYKKQVIGKGAVAEE